MSLEKVIEYIKERRKEEAEDTQIKKELLEVGWTTSQLEDAFNNLDTNTNKDKTIKPAPKKGANLNTNKKALLVSGFVFILLTGGAFGYFFGGEKLFNRSTPEEELISAFENMSDLNSLSSTTSFNMEYQGTEPHQQFSGNLSFVDRADKKNNEMEFILKGSGMSNGKGGEFKAKMILVNDKAFVRLDKFLDLGILIHPFVNVSDINTILGKNILVVDNLSENFEEIKDGKVFYLETKETLPSPKINPGEIFNDDVDPQVAKDFLKDLKERLLEKDVVFIGETNEDLVDGAEVSRHSIKFNLDPLPEIINKIIVEYEEYIKPEAIDEIVVEIDEFEKDLTKAEEEFGEKFYNDLLTVQIWNDKDYVYKVEVAIDQIEEYAEDIEDSKIVINSEFSDFNESLNIAEPKDYIEIEKLIEEIFRNSQKNTLADTQINSELVELRNNAEQYYYGEGSDSYSGFKTSSDWKEISKQVPECTGLDSYQVNISDHEIVIWSPLCSEEGFYCIDSEANAGVYKDKIGEGYSCDDFFKKTKDQEEQTDDFYFPGFDEERNSTYDIHIKSDLSQARSNAEQYYYSNNGSYTGFDYSDGWEKLSTESPDCTGEDIYQISVSDQKYASWSPLCSEEAFYCVDAEGNVGTYQQKVGEGYSCEEIFD